MSRLLEGKVTLITGGAAGIGEACARAFAERGARVVVGDVDAERGERVAREIGGLFVVCDVASAASFGAAIETAVRWGGRLDVLVNNAGVALPAATVQETSEAEFDRLVAVNLKGTYLGCRLAHGHLKASRGCVLNVSSMSGVTGQERHAVYAATKGAINALTKSVAVDWGKEGIRINAICPTGVWTETLRAWAEVQPDKGEIAGYLNRIHSLGYCPEAGEIAPVAAFLCSDEAKFVTGCLMPVSGGSECGYKL